MVGVNVVRRELWKRLIDEALQNRSSKLSTESSSKNRAEKEKPKALNGFSMSDERGLLIPSSVLNECRRPTHSLQDKANALGLGIAR